MPAYVQIFRKCSPPAFCILLISLGSIVYILAGLRSNKSPPFRSAPRLELPDNRLDLGLGKPNQLLHGILRLRNVGDQPLEFNIASSCGCTEVVPRQGRIACGLAADVRIAVKLPDHANSERTLRLSIASNDPDNPTSTCLVRCTCPAAFQVTPEFVEFGDLSGKRTEDKAVRLALLLPAGEERRINARLSGSSFSIVPNLPASINVSPLTTLTEGDYAESLELWLQGDESSIVRVPLRAKITPPLTTIPASLNLRKDEAGKLAPIRLILVSGEPIAPDHIEVLHPPAEFKITSSSGLGNRRIGYCVEIPDGWDTPQDFTLEFKDRKTGHHTALHLFSPDHVKTPKLHDNRN